MTDVIGALGRPPQGAAGIVIDPPYFGYIRLVWLLMDGLEVALGWRSMLIVRIYDALCAWGIRRWVHWESEAQAMVRKYGFKSFTVDKVERWT